jgi:hypothetical protein
VKENSVLNACHTAGAISAFFTPLIIKSIMTEEDGGEPGEPEEAFIPSFLNLVPQHPFSLSSRSYRREDNDDIIKLKAFDLSSERESPYFMPF